MGHGMPLCQTDNGSMFLIFLTDMYTQNAKKNRKHMYSQKYLTLAPVMQNNRPNELNGMESSSNIQCILYFNYFR